MLRRIALVGPSCALALLLFSQAASAADLPPDWNQVRYYAKVKPQGFIGAYLAGAGAAFMADNIALALMKRPPLYCQPDNLALNGLDYTRIFENELALWGPKVPDSVQTTFVEYVLLKGLQRTFPCPSPSAAETVSAALVTLSCRIEDPGNRTYGFAPSRVTIQVRIDEVNKSVSFNNGKTLTANISDTQISYRDPSGKPMNYMIDRSSGDLTVSAVDGMGILSGHCSKVNPEHRAF